MFIEFQLKTFATHWRGKKWCTNINNMVSSYSCLRQGCPIHGLENCLFSRKNFPRGVHPVSCWEQLRDSCYCCSEFKYLVFVSLFTFVWCSLCNFIIHKKWKNFIFTFLWFPDLVPPFLKASSYFLRSINFSIL